MVRAPVEALLCVLQEERGDVIDNVAVLGVLVDDMSHLDEIPSLYGANQDIRLLSFLTDGEGPSGVLPHSH